MHPAYAISWVECNPDGLLYALQSRTGDEKSWYGARLQYAIGEANSKSNGFVRQTVYWK